MPLSRRIFRIQPADCQITKVRRLPWQAEENINPASFYLCKANYKYMLQIICGFLMISGFDSFNSMLLPAASTVGHQATSSLFNISQPQAFSTTTNHEFFQHKPTLGLVNTRQPQAFSTTTNHGSVQQQPNLDLVNTIQPQAFSTTTNHGLVQQQPTLGLVNTSQAIYGRVQ